MARVFKSSLLLVVLLFLITPHIARADALRDIDDAASKKGDPSSSPPPRSRDEDDDSDEDQDEDGWSSSTDDDDDDDLGWALLIASPWTLPIYAMDEPCLRGYARHPFADGQGHLRADGGACKRPGTKPAPETPRRVAAQLDMESGYLSDQVVPATLALRMQLPHRFELSARSSLLTDLAATDTERAYQNNALVSIRFAQGKRADLRSGLGMRHFRLDKDRWGFDSLYGIDFFTRHHIVGRMELHLGSLSRAVVFEARGTLGVMLGKVELYAGADFMAVVGPRETARLGGAVGGVRFWF
jgi:hypothetical protein